VKAILDFEKEKNPFAAFSNALTESAALLHNLLVQVKELVMLVGLTESFLSGPVSLAKFCTKPNYSSSILD